MRSNVNESTIEQLLEEARRDGIKKLVVGAVIVKDGQCLLLEREPADFMGGLVELPSGTVDPEEDLLEALAREVREETSLVIHSVQKYLGSFDYTSRSGKKTRQFNFLVETLSGVVIVNPKEHVSYRFIAPSDEVMAALNISDETKKVLKVVEGK